MLLKKKIKNKNHYSMVHNCQIDFNASYKTVIICIYSSNYFHRNSYTTWAICLSCMKHNILIYTTYVYRYVALTDTLLGNRFEENTSFYSFIFI